MDIALLRIRLFALVGVLGLFLLAPAPASAIVHIAEIHEVMAGVGGDADAQYVEINQRSVGQNITINSKLSAFDSAGNFIDGDAGTAGDQPLHTMPSNVANSGDGSRWLIGTQAFKDLPTFVDPDFVFPANPGLTPNAGMVCLFEAPRDFTDPSQSVDCVAYGGASFTGVNPNSASPGTNDAALPGPGNGVHSLTRITPATFVAGPPWAKTADPANDFALAAPTPENNTAGVAFPGGVTLPEGFSERVLAAGFTGATAVDWAPDGRMFVAEQRGRVLVLPANPTPEERANPSTLLDISGHVNSFFERGLLGLAVDSDFAQNHYLYLLYSYDSDTVDDSGPTVSRLTRVTVSDTNAVSPEVVVLGAVTTAPCPAPDNTVDCIPGDGTSHVIGTVRSDSDGTLWVGSGDAAFNFSDFGFNDLAYRTYDERTYVGKILHVDRQGQGLSGHAFCPADTDLTHVCTKIHAKGLRNPFRFTLRESGGPALADVGFFDREEFEIVASGKSYGWPCYEGTLHTQLFEDSQQCADLYALEGGPDAETGPDYEYSHETGHSVVGGPTYVRPAVDPPVGTRYPAAFDGQIFFGDTVTGFISRLDPGQPIVTAPEFATGLPSFGVVDLELAPGSNLTHIDYGGSLTAVVPEAGRVWELVYDPAAPPYTSDADAFPDRSETFIGTDPLDACPEPNVDPDPATEHHEPGELYVAGDNVWPPDLNNDRHVNITNDIIGEALQFGSTEPRYDVDAQNGVVNIADVFKVASFFGPSPFCPS